MLFFAIAGLSVGSFLNLCIDRLPLSQSIITPPSHCPVCQRRVPAYDLIPLFNYFWLRGQCRYCRARIPVRLPVIELATGLTFAFLYWKFGTSHELGMSLVYACFMIVIFVIDLEHHLILNKVVYPGIVVAFAFSFVWPELGVLGALIGGAVGFAFLFLPYLVYPRGMGMGDVKLALMIGLMAGWRGALVALLMAALVGGLLSLFLLLFRLKRRGEGIPFGPFLAVAAMVALLWGESISDWYLDLFQ